MDATTKVLQLPELLEEILLCQDYRSIFRAQRVCSQWRAVIKGSPRIRQALFLIPSDHKPVLMNPFFLDELYHWKRPYETPKPPSGDRPVHWSRREGIFYARASWRQMLPASIPSVLSVVRYENASESKYYKWQDRGRTRQEFIFSGRIDNGITMGELFHYSLNFSSRFKCHIWWLYRVVKDVHHNGSENKSILDLLLCGSSDLFEVEGRAVWRPDRSRPAVRTLIRMKYLE
ncbi:hypothetical protein ASPBRDRAFT_135088 [Aspergillus brasiliensis CBS 101740]|uniref:F-box domain-containing protein n=1 Tax=Aspergillus brasiliensis (strain CBS 101740 / IMI 381727 / IBT 21946) TaxID=767769 RepID=A0A1L9U7Q1_ASPBC|nr:hypothetical protein ASPBRDRAFT_135088 [Aspergillus brasiliensis CBS 101740]